MRFATVVTSSALARSVERVGGCCSVGRGDGAAARDRRRSRSASGRGCSVVATSTTARGGAASAATGLLATGAGRAARLRRRRRDPGHRPVHLPSAAGLRALDIELGPAGAVSGSHDDSLRFIEPGGRLALRVLAHERRPGPLSGGSVLGVEEVNGLGAAPDHGG